MNIYIFVYICIYTHLYIYLHIHIYIHICMCIYVQAHAHWDSVYAHVCARSSIWAFICVRMCMLRRCAQTSALGASSHTVWRL